MELTNTDREKAAMHEAGHALVAAARDVRVISIEVLGDGGEGGARIDRSESDLDQAWIAHGGPQAEIVIYGQCETRWTPPGQDDRTIAYEAAQRAGEYNPDIMRQVKQFLQEHRAGLELVAQRLLEDTVVQGDELEQLLQEALNG